MPQKLSQLIDAIGWPWLGCAVVAALLIRAGLRSSARGAVLGNVALAQWVALGQALALLLQEKEMNIPVWLCAAGLGLVAALLLTAGDSEKVDIPRELIAGGMLAAGGTIGFLLLQRVKETDDEVRRLLGGELLLARREQIWLVLGVFVILAALSFVVQKKLESKPLRLELALRILLVAGLAVFLPMGGLILTASFFLVPVLCGRLASASLCTAWRLGCVIAAAAAPIGLTAAFKMDLPSGAAVAGAMSVALILCAPLALRRRSN
jgi:ABC-type Mn2+/Zn2+ transport system permease subunit